MIHFYYFGEASRVLDLLARLYLPIWFNGDEFTSTYLFFYSCQTLTSTYLPWIHYLIVVNQRLQVILQILVPALSKSEFVLNRTVQSLSIFEFCIDQQFFLQLFLVPDLSGALLGAALLTRGLHGMLGHQTVWTESERKTVPEVYTKPIAQCLFKSIDIIFTSERYELSLK